MRDPKQQGPQPEFPQRPTAPPGREADMRPRADHGEESYRGSGRLTNHVALITGADSGIGRAVALAFAREGADIVVSYLEEHEDAAETGRWVAHAGRKALLVPGDITDERHCRTLVDRTIDEFGGIDVLVNNAAFQRTHETIEEFSSEEFDRTFRTNVYAMFWLCRAALPRMKKGASIRDTSFERPAQPAEIAPVYVFLASNDARYVTGEVYGVTGGKSPY